jgi:hypothetical protein
MTTIRLRAFMLSPAAMLARDRAGPTAPLPTAATSEMRGHMAAAGVQWPDLAGPFALHPVLDFPAGTLHVDNAEPEPSAGTFSEDATLDADPGMPS